MFAKLAVALSTLAVFVAAVPAPQLPTPYGGAPASVSQCNTGASHCCNQVHQVNSPQANDLLHNFIGVDVGSLVGQLGFQCNPVTVIGGTLSPNCAQQPVCCEGNTANGLVNVGCVPISV